MRCSEQRVSRNFLLTKVTREHVRELSKVLPHSDRLVYELCQGKPETVMGRKEHVMVMHSTLLGRHVPKASLSKKFAVWEQQLSAGGNGLKLITSCQCKRKAIREQSLVISGAD